jgi:hypothetical protein
MAIARSEPLLVAGAGADELILIHRSDMASPLRQLGKPRSLNRYALPVKSLCERASDTTRHDTTRHDTTRHDTTRHDTTRHDTTRAETSTVVL